MEVIELVWLISDSGKKIKVRYDETVSKERCQKDPAGRVLKKKSDGKEACIFLYDEDMNPIKDATDVKDWSEEELLDALGKSSSGKGVENLSVE